MLSENEMSSKRAIRIMIRNDNKVKTRSELAIKS